MTLCTEDEKKNKKNLDALADRIYEHVKDQKETLTITKAELKKELKKAKEGTEEHAKIIEKMQELEKLESQIPSKD